MQISRKRFETDTWYQLPTNRKWPMADRMMTSLMTSLMTSRDRERSRSWSQCLSGPEIETWLQRGTYRKWHAWYRIVMWCDRWRHRTFKGQGRDPNIFKARYFKNSSRLRLGFNGAPSPSPTLYKNSIKNSLGGYMHSLIAFYLYEYLYRYCIRNLYAMIW